MGRGDDEPDRQHSLQRAAAHVVHDQLRGHSRRHRSERVDLPHRLPDAVAAARDVRLRRDGRRRLSRVAQERRPRRPDYAVEEAEDVAAALAARRAPGTRHVARTVRARR